MFHRSLIQPIAGGLTASPSAWMMKMFIAKAVARIDGCVTFARIVLLGPVLKNRKNTAPKIQTHASGNGVCSISSTNGQAHKIPSPETRKYDPLKYFFSQSPTNPPDILAKNPATHRIPPTSRCDDAGSLRAPFR